jgi:hypothetical protein
MRLTEFNKLTRVQGRGVSQWKKLLIDHYVDYMFTQFNDSFPLTVKLKKMRKGLNGSMELKLINSGDNVIAVSSELGVPLLLTLIAHEAVHIKQVNDGFLSLDDSGIIWKGKTYITAQEYAVLDYETYAQLPWEHEAITKSKLIKSEYIQKKMYKELAGQDKMLDYVIDIGF